MSYYPQQQAQHPPLPPPWYAEWDQRDQRYLFINPQTGERTFEHPHPTYQQSYGQPQYNQPPPGQYEQQQYGQQAGYGYQQQQPPKQNSHKGLEYGALGAVGGLVAGAVAMHEGEKIHRDYDEDKDRIEDRVDYDGDRVENRFDEDRNRFDNRVDYDEQRVEDFPEDAAGWAGRKVQDVEDVPYDVRNDYDDARQDVEDVPDDVAGWAGRKVGDVDRFDDNIDNAYDQGRDEQRYDDRY